MDQEDWACAERTARLVGVEAYERLRRARVVVVGLGGVGAMCAEALARSGVGYLRLVDHDRVAPSNLNRQLHALRSTIGLEKATVLAERLAAFVPAPHVDPRVTFLERSNAPELLEGVDLLVDAIDSMGPKVALLAAAQRLGVRAISSQGAAGKLDPTRVRVVPLKKTREDPLAAQVRKQLRHETGTLDGIHAVYSEEEKRDSLEGPWSVGPQELCRGRPRIPQPSLMMVPAAMGLAAAHWVVSELLGHVAGPQSAGETVPERP